MSEADERLPAGPRGKQGDRGEQGRRGLSQIQGRAIVVLFVIPVVLAVFAIFWDNHTVTANDHKFCSVVTAVTAVPVPKPADPAADPSRQRQYEWYQRFVRLGQDLGC